MAIATEIITDPQQMFNHVVEHLAEQGKQALGVSGVCVYRLYDDNKKVIGACAMGCLIPDSYYNNRWECKLSKELFDENETLSHWNTPYLRALINALQKAHDDAPINLDGTWNFEDGRSIKDRLHEIAYIFELDEEIIYTTAWKKPTS